MNNEMNVFCHVSSSIGRPFSAVCVSLSSSSSSSSHHIIPLLPTSSPAQQQQKKTCGSSSSSSTRRRQSGGFISPHHRNTKRWGVLRPCQRPAEQHPASQSQHPAVAATTNNNKQQTQKPPSKRKAAAVRRECFCVSVVLCVWNSHKLPDQLSKSSCVFRPQMCVL